MINCLVSFCECNASGCVDRDKFEWWRDCHSLSKVGNTHHFTLYIKFGANSIGFSIIGGRINVKLSSFSAQIQCWLWKSMKIQQVTLPKNTTWLLSINKVARTSTRLLSGNVYWDYQSRNRNKSPTSGMFSFAQIRKKCSITHKSGEAIKSVDIKKSSPDLWHQCASRF